MNALIQQGGLMMGPLLICSMMALAVIFERALFWRKAHQHGQTCQVDRVILARKKKEALDPSWSQSKDPVTQVLIQALVFKGKARQSWIDHAISQELQRVKRFMGILDTIISIAPLLGILGTVMGIIVSFNLLGGAGLQDPKAVTGGIAQALITTAFGLLIAIVSMVPYNYFLSRIDAFVSKLESSVSRLEWVESL